MAHSARHKLTAAALALAALALLAALAPGAEARRPALTTTQARSIAEEEALDQLVYHPWAFDYEITSCSRSSRTRARCAGDISGVEFEDCSDVTYECTYIARRCDFDVFVKRVGTSSLSRAQNLRCTASPFSD